MREAINVVVLPSRSSIIMRDSSAITMWCDAFFILGEAPDNHIDFICRCIIHNINRALKILKTEFIIRKRAELKAAQGAGGRLGSWGHPPGMGSCTQRICADLVAKKSTFSGEVVQDYIYKHTLFKKCLTQTNSTDICSFLLAINNNVILYDYYLIRSVLMLGWVDDHRP